jgi:hypothetical protein
VTKDEVCWFIVLQSSRITGHEFIASVIYPEEVQENQPITDLSSLSQQITRHEKLHWVFGWKYSLV